MNRKSDEQKTAMVLARKLGETIVINGNVSVTVNEIRGGKVRLLVVAPRGVTVNRQEVQDAIDSKAVRS
jgi:carbon storage regulator